MCIYLYLIAMLKQYYIEIMYLEKVRFVWTTFICKDKQRNQNISYACFTVTRRKLYNNIFVSYTTFQCFLLSNSFTIYINESC